MGYYVSPGQRYCRWTVLEDSDKKSDKVLCRCQCGTERRVVVRHLLSRESASCGCLRNERASRAQHERWERDRALISIEKKEKDSYLYIAPGDQFGFWRAIEGCNQTLDRILCRCVCGTERTVIAFELVRGKSRSCGCRQNTLPQYQLYPDDKYGAWTVLEAGYKAGAKVLCQCVCGTSRSVLIFDLVNGKSRSCGCIESTRHRSANGLSKHPLYGVWRGIIRRCYSGDPSWRAYASYEGRGIKVCDRWMPPTTIGFVNFLEDMGERPGRGYQVDRIDPNGNYDPSNCRWWPAGAGEQRPIITNAQYDALRAENDRLRNRIRLLKRRLVYRPPTAPVKFEAA